jgi:hypothetical protein
MTNAAVDYAAAFFFRSAQRFFMARPIFLRAAADSRRLRPSGLPVAVLGMFRLPRRAAMALLRRSRSPSSSAMIDCVSKGLSLLVFRMATILQERSYRPLLAGCSGHDNRGPAEKMMRQADIRTTMKYGDVVTNETA